MIQGAAACALLNLGGTIGELYDATGLSRRASARMLLAGADLPPEWPGHDVALLDSVDLNFEALEAAAAVIAADRTSSGFILCCGTDLLEEVAYAASLLLPDGRPIVVTAAALPASELGSDGPANLRRAALLIANGLADGTMVVMGDAIFAPTGLTKLEPQAMQPFAAPDGPSGRFRGGKPKLGGGQQVEDHFRTLSAYECRARVPILHEHIGGTDLFVDPARIDGLVVAGAGAGGLSARTRAMLRAEYLPKVPVVLSTRCPFGFAIDSGQPKHALAAERADGFRIDGYTQLNAVQARIRLILEIGLSRREISHHDRRAIS